MSSHRLYFAAAVAYLIGLTLLVVFAVFSVPSALLSTTQADPVPVQEVSKADPAVAFLVRRELDRRCAAIILTPEYAASDKARKMCSGAGKKVE